MKKLLNQSKKGAMSLDQVGTVFLTLILIAVLGVATYLTLAGLQTAASDGNATNQVAAESAVTNFTLSIDNVVGFAPVWGTIIGVAVLIGIVLTAFSFGRRGGGAGDAL